MMYADTYEELIREIEASDDIRLSDYARARIYDCLANRDGKIVRLLEEAEHAKTVLRRLWFGGVETIEVEKLLFEEDEAETHYP